MILLKMFVPLVKFIFDTAIHVPCWKFLQLEFFKTLGQVFSNQGRMEDGHMVNERLNFLGFCFIFGF